MAEFVDRLVGDPEHVEVHNVVITRTSYEVDNACEERFDRVTSNNDRSRTDSFGFCGITEKRPDPTGFVNLIYVSREGDSHVRFAAHDDLLVK